MAWQTMNINMVVPAIAYPYLVAQNGALNDMRADPDTWCGQYADMLDSRMQLITPHLPASCNSVLDVGGGMGGIDALINAHYGGVHVTILDGIDDEPLVERHAKTFSNMNAAAEFLCVNGVTSFDFIDANRTDPKASRFYDLVVSFKSWCFHVPPEQYLDLVRSCVIAKHTKLIIDVRMMRQVPGLGDAYLNVLSTNFRHIKNLFTGVKFETHLFEAA